MGKFFAVVAICALISVGAYYGYQYALKRNVPIVVSTDKAIKTHMERKDIIVDSVPVRVEIARTPEEHEQGLSGRDSLGENEGMIFTFGVKAKVGFWMAGMKFPLDFVWISDHKVVQLMSDVPVPTGEANVFFPDMPVDAVLEVNAGWIKKHGIEIGGTVEY